MSRKKVTIYGASGCGNVGDDLIAVTLVRMLQKHLYGVDVYLSPQDTRDDIETSDAIVIGGGGLIYDYDFGNVVNYTDIIFRAADQQLPVYLVGMGVQHVFSERALNMYRDAMRHVNAVSVRNDDDAKFFIEKLGYDPKKIIVSRDLVFLSKDLLNVKVPAQKTQARKTLILALADWKLGKKNYETIGAGLAEQQDRYLSYLQDNISKLTERYSVKLVCQASEDVGLYKKLMQSDPKLELVTFGSVEASTELLEVYAQADVAVTGRYHGLIAGIVTNTPTISVSFGGHKQTKLIDDSFGSLRKQLLTVGEFVERDVLNKLLDDDYVAQLRTSTRFERWKCNRLAKRNYTLVKKLAGELAKV